MRPRSRSSLRYVWCSLMRCLPRATTERWSRPPCLTSHTGSVAACGQAVARRRRRRPRADAGSGACHWPPWCELPWPLLASTPLKTEVSSGRPLRAPRWLARRPGPGATAGCGRWRRRRHRSAPSPRRNRSRQWQRQRRQLQSARPTRRSSGTGGSRGTERDQPGPEPHLMADQPAVVECLPFFGGHVSSSLTCRALLRRPSTRSRTPQAMASGVGHNRLGVLSNTSPGQACMPGAVDHQSIGFRPAVGLLNVVPTVRLGAPLKVIPRSRRAAT